MKFQDEMNHPKSFPPRALRAAPEVPLAARALALASCWEKDFHLLPAVRRFASSFPTSLNGGRRRKRAHIAQRGVVVTALKIAHDQCG